MDRAQCVMGLARVGSRDMPEPERHIIDCYDAHSCPFADQITKLVDNVAKLTISTEVIARLPEVVNKLGEQVQALQVELARMIGKQTQKETDQERAATNQRWIWQIIVTMVLLGAGVVIGHLVGGK